MVANSNSVTTAPARTPAPATPRASAPAGAVQLPAAQSPAGNDTSATGRDLPALDLADLAVDVERALQRLHDLMSNSQRSLRFQVDQISGRTVITVLDATTNEVVRQIPPPEWLEVVRRLEQAGTLLDVHS